MNEPTELDHLLASWARGVRLTDAVADDIRREILADPLGNTDARAHLDRGTRGTAPSGPPATAPGRDSGTTPPGGPLPVTWWRNLALQVSDVVVRAGIAGAPALTGQAGAPRLGYGYQA